MIRLRDMEKWHIDYSEPKDRNRVYTEKNRAQKHIHTKNDKQNEY